MVIEVNFEGWLSKANNNMFREIRTKNVLSLQALLVSDFGPKITIKIVESLREDILAAKLKSGSEIKVPEA